MFTSSSVCSGELPWGWQERAHASASCGTRRLIAGRGSLLARTCSDRQRVGSYPVKSVKKHVLLLPTAGLVVIYSQSRSVRLSVTECTFQTLTTNKDLSGYSSSPAQALPRRLCWEGTKPLRWGPLLGKGRDEEEERGALRITWAARTTAVAAGTVKASHGARRVLTLWTAGGGEKRDGDAAIWGPPSPVP